MTCFHIPYLILSHIPFLLSFIFFQSFWLQGELGHLGLLGLETFGPWEDNTEDYLLRSDVQLLPYQGVHPSRHHGVDTLLDILPGQLRTRLDPLQQ